ncbi:MAG: hypothetical protein NBV68_03355 [Erythrobacter sp.]|uniref:hypothetical protein n=1 Tax=Erythrobacter sp. TaxID=1042 RepID=UPI0025EB4A7D|nr:hypothetical protein [Erythrobacter sp.]MCL9998395.1 hypothetical protein [Erythrobacter sp.]
MMTLHDLPDDGHHDFGFADPAAAKAAVRAMRDARAKGDPASYLGSKENRFRFKVSADGVFERPADAGFASVGAAKVAAIAPGEISGERHRPETNGSDLPADGGMASIEGARAAIRRIKLRLALADVGTSVAGLLQVLDHGLNAERDENAPVGERGIGLAPGDIEGCVGGLAVDGVESKDVREKELLEGVDVVLQFLDALGIGLRHGLFSSSGSQRTNPTPTSGQSLCDGSKYGDAA